MGVLLVGAGFAEVEGVALALERGMGLGAAGLPGGGVAGMAGGGAFFASSSALLSEPSDDRFELCPKSAVEIWIMHLYE